MQGVGRHRRTGLGFLDRGDVGRDPSRTRVPSGQRSIWQRGNAASGPPPSKCAVRKVSDASPVSVALVGGADQGQVLGRGRK